MRLELLPVPPLFENGVEINVSSNPERGSGNSYSVVVHHPMRKGVSHRQQFEAPSGCSVSDLRNRAVWINFLPETWRLMVTALWVAGADAYAEIETFENSPVSIGEFKADKSRDAKDWKPREALVELLRRIDNGEYPDMDALILAWRERTAKGEISSYYSASSPDIHVSLGVLARAEYMMHEIASGG